MNTSLHDSYLDAKAFERDFSLSPRTFFLWIQEGKLTAYKPSKRKTLVKRSDVEKLLDSSRAVNDLDRVVNEVVRDVAGR